MPTKPKSHNSNNHSRCLHTYKNTFESTIPVLNMQNFYTNKKLFVMELHDALKTVGFFGIENTSIQQIKLNRTYSNAKLFFEQSYEQKTKISSATNSGERGFVGGSESPVGKDIKFKDHKEFIHFGRELSDHQQRRLNYPKNIWPENIDLKSGITELFAIFDDLVRPLSEAIELATGAPSKYLQEMTMEGDHLFRLVRYPKTCQVKQEGAAPHTDSNLFTLLPPATSKGLQVLVDQEWLPIVVPPGAVIVNGGSMLEHMTNGYFRAAEHRVQYESNSDRYSVAFFVHTRENDPMTPLPSCVSLTGGKQIYPAATRQELLDQRLIAMDRATKEKITNYAASKLLSRWQDYISTDDSRKAIVAELEKVEQVLKTTIK